MTNERNISSIVAVAAMVVVAVMLGAAFTVQAPHGGDQSAMAARGTEGDQQDAPTSTMAARPERLVSSPAGQEEIATTTPMPVFTLMVITPNTPYAWQTASPTPWNTPTPRYDPEVTVDATVLGGDPALHYLSGTYCPFNWQNVRAGPSVLDVYLYSLKPNQCRETFWAYLWPDGDTWFGITPDKSEWTAYLLVTGSNYRWYGTFTGGD